MSSTWSVFDGSRAASFRSSLSASVGSSLRHQESHQHTLECPLGRIGFAQMADRRLELSGFTKLLQNAQPEKQQPEVARIAGEPGFDLRKRVAKLSGHHPVGGDDGDRVRVSSVERECGLRFGPGSVDVVEANEDRPRKCQDVGVRRLKRVGRIR